MKDTFIKELTALKQTGTTISQGNDITTKKAKADEQSKQNEKLASDEHFKHNANVELHSEAEPGSRRRLDAQLT